MNTKLVFKIVGKALIEISEAMSERTIGDAKRDYWEAKALSESANMQRLNEFEAAEEVSTKWSDAPEEIIREAKEALSGITGYEPPIDKALSKLQDTIAAKETVPAPPETVTPPPPPPAETVTPPPPPPPVATSGPIELDSEGLPWDDRIHARTQTKLKTGTWKLKRGVDAVVVAQVKTELRGSNPAPATSASPPTGINQPIGFVELVTKIGVAKKNGVEMDVDKVIFEETGLKGLAELSIREELVPTVALALGIS